MEVFFLLLLFFFEFVSVVRNYTAFVTKYFRASVRAGDVGFCFPSRFQTTNGWKGQKCQVWGFKVHVLKSQLVAVCSCATYVELFYHGNRRKQQLWGEFTWWTVLNWHSNSNWLIALLERCPLQATDQMKPSVQILDCRGKENNSHIHSLDLVMTMITKMMMMTITVQADLMLFFFLELSFFRKEAAESLFKIKQIGSKIDRLQTTLNIAFKFYITLFKFTRGKTKKKIKSTRSCWLLINKYCVLWRVGALMCLQNKSRQRRLEKSTPRRCWSDVHRRVVAKPFFFFFNSSASTSQSRFAPLTTTTAVVFLLHIKINYIFNMCLAFVSI